MEKHDRIVNAPATVMNIMDLIREEREEWAKERAHEREKWEEARAERDRAFKLK